LESRSFWLDTIPLSENKAANRATAAQFPRNIRRGVRRNIRRIIRATFGQRPRNIRATSAQYSCNSRDVSGQLAGDISQNAEECPRQSLHQSWRDGSQMTWYLPPQSTHSLRNIR